MYVSRLIMDDGNEKESQNSNRFIKQNNKFPRAFIFLPSLNDYDVRMPNFMFCGGRKQAVPKKSSPGKFAYIRHFQLTGINATKFEKTPIHFKSVIFDAVAVVDLLELCQTAHLMICTTAISLSQHKTIEFFRFWTTTATSTRFSQY